jgi:arsenite methyltransferase
MRPGGLIITDRALALCGFKKGAKLVDLGCGGGTTVGHLVRDFAFLACGVDENRRALGSAENLMLATSERAPFKSGVMDGVLLECALSKMDDPKIVLGECRRLLKREGRLILSDLYARGVPARLEGRLGRVDTKETLLSVLSGSGFTVESFEDCSAHLKTAWGQLILERGLDSLCEELCADAATLEAVKCGYFLCIARKEG